MKRHLILTAIALLLNISTTWAQNTSTDSSYYAELWNHYQAQVQKDSTKWKHFARAKAKVFDKLDQSGSMQSYKRAVGYGCSNICPPPDQADWQLCGPFKHEVGNVQWNGFVSRVNPDPLQVNATDPAQNSVLATPTAGIWQYDYIQGMPPTMREWTNRTDNYRASGMGITEIVRNPANSNYLMASTGINHTGDYGNHLGLLSSVMNGQVWNPFTPMFPGFDACNTNITGIWIKYDSRANPMDLLYHFYIIVRKPSAGVPDELWEYCNDGISSTKWYNRTPQAYINAVTFPGGNPHLQLTDFTAAPSGLLVTARNPFGNTSEIIFHSLFDGSGSACRAPLLWSEISSRLPFFNNGQNQGISLSDAKKDTVFARATGNDYQNLYRTNDGGQTWTRVFTGLNQTSQLDMEYSPHTQNLYLSRYNRMLVLNFSTGSPVAYQAPHTSAHADLRDFAEVGPTNTGKWLVFFATDGGVSRMIYDPASTNFNTAFTFLPVSGESMPIQQAWGLGITQTTLTSKFAGMMHNHSFGYHNGSWCKFGGGDGGDIEVNQVDNSTIYFSINPSIRKVDINSFCNSLGTPIGFSSNWQYGRPLELHPANQCKLYYGDDFSGANYARLRVFDDCGGTSADYKLGVNVTDGNNNTPPQFMTEIGAIGLSETNSNLIFLGHESYYHPAGNWGRILKSVDHGSSWKDISNAMVSWSGGNGRFHDVLAWMPIGDIVVSPYDENLVFLSMKGTKDDLRVLKSTDGGLNWSDYSDGLPGLPVEALEFQHNSPNRLFACTDAGVYYIDDNTNGQWVCFNENLPMVWTTDLEINYCNDSMYASTHGRGIYMTSLASLSKSPREQVVSSNTVWTGQRVLQSNVRVLPGVTLDIQNATIRLAEDVSILIEPTAQVNITNSDLSAQCDGSCWAGITVKGNHNQVQTTAFQGKITVDNSSLSHAKEAIFSLNGGIVEVKKSSFKENRRAIGFDWYQNGTRPEYANVSFIEDSDFSISDDYRNCGSNEAFITMFSVNGIEIRGCDFSDKRVLGINSPSDFRTGIKTSSATFKVMPGTSAQASTFGPLYLGIQAEDVEYTNNFEIDIRDAYFENCEVGISLLKVNKESKLISNTLEVGQSNNPVSFGIVLKESSGFVVSENVIRKNTLIGGHYAVGIEVVDSNNPNSGFYPENDIYSNFCKSLNVGFRAWGNNVKASGQGLEFLCNRNVGNVVDFEFQSCIQTSQGSAASPAGNTFSCGSSTPFLVSTGGTCIDYFHTSAVPTCLASPTGINLMWTPNTSGCNYITSAATLQTGPAIEVYPNPAKEQVFIDFTLPQGMQELSLSLIDLQGKMVYRKQLRSLTLGKNQVSVETGALPNGMYLLQLKGDNLQASKKLVIAH